MPSLIAQLIIGLLLLLATGNTAGRCRGMRHCALLLALCDCALLNMLVLLRAP